MESMISSRGKSLLVLNGYKFRHQKMLINGDQRWACCMQNCLAYARTNPLGELTVCSLQHDHEPLGNNELNWEKLKNTVKEKVMMGEDLEVVLSNLPDEVGEDEVQKLRRRCWDWKTKSNFESQGPDTSANS